MSNRGRKRNQIPVGYVYILAAVIALILILGVVIAVKKYTPTKERMDLTEYFNYKEENEAVVILNNEYIEVPEDKTHVYAICQDGHVYLQYDFLKDYLDDGYVYDSNEITLRYATDDEIYTAVVGNSDYTIDKSSQSLGYNILVTQDDTVYIAADYAKLLTDFQYTYYENPYRVVIESAGFTKTVATVKGKTQIRRLGGPKSPILEDAVKGENVTVLNNIGKWTEVLTENGVLGYIRNNKLSATTEETVETTLEERTYNHMSAGSDILLAWHQVTSTSANADIANVLADSGNLDVISPTWFYLNDNKGGIVNLASTSYVDYCHENGVQVWALISNLENPDVSTTDVLNSTSARDALINNLIAAAITYDLDGLNIDIEELSASAADGYIQFIKELSIKCENNDIILSVDNYVPTESSGCYNRSQQALYADYVVIMGYDEYYGSSQEAGSVASLDWVEQGVKDTLEDVPAEQVILGMPFYCRVWKIDSAGQVSSNAYGMDAIQTFLKTNDATTSWDETEGQYYAEFVKDDATYKIWVEDETSIEEKLKVMDQYGLAGGAFWKLGFDNSSVWNTIAKYL